MKGNLMTQQSTFRMWAVVPDFFFAEDVYSTSLSNLLLLLKRHFFLRWHLIKRTLTATSCLMLNKRHLVQIFFHTFSGV